MVMRILVVSTMLSLAVLTGCGQATEKAIEAATGADVEIDGNKTTIVGESGESLTIDMDEGVTTFTDEEGGTVVSGGSGVQAPDGLPAGFPLPGSGTLISALDDPSSGTIILTYAWENMSKSDFDSYVASLVGAGYAPSGDVIEQDFGDDGFLRALSLQGQSETVSVNAQGMPDGGSLTITIASTG